jgi:hypothetical protein
MKRGLALAVVVSVFLTSAGCARLGTLAELIQPPRFEEASDRPRELRLLAPSTTMPAGGAVVRVWTRVSNPNRFGFTLDSLGATLAIEGVRAATADLPLGLPLEAGQESVIPIELSVSFLDVPTLADALRRAAPNRAFGYAIDGTVGVDAGRLGRRMFGPMAIARGNLQVLGGPAPAP